MNILLTAFEPFGGERVNPAQLAVEALPQTVCGAEISKLLLPVSYREAPKLVRKAIRTLQPDAVLCVGQAGGRNAVTPERVAINFMGAELPDNDGKRVHGKPILRNAPAAYFSTLPIERMVNRLRRARLPATVSNTAGTFICNQVMYTVLHEIAEKKLPVQAAGFVHVPYVPEQTKEKPGVFSLPQEKLTKALALCVETVVRELTNYVYMIRCADGSLYTGWTNDIEKRMQAHATRQGAKYTRAHAMQELAYLETFPNRTLAMRREWEIKQLTHAQKQELIKQRAKQP